MKKFIVSILAVLYITTSTGAVVHLHYCMDKLIGWGLWDNKKMGGKCGTCGMNKTGKKKDCCKDENKLVKIEKDQKTTDVNYNLGKPFLNVPFYTNVFSHTNTILLFNLLTEYLVSHAPPKTGEVPLFVRNCIFLI